MDAHDLTERHYRRLHAIACRLHRNPTDAWDLVQDTFERALHRPCGFPDAARERAWLVSVMHNLFIDHCRAMRHEPRPVDCPERLDERVSPAADHDTPSWETLGRQELEDAIAQLAPKFGEVYRLHAQEGCSYEQIAARLSIPKATVGTRLLRARRCLRQLLEQCPPGHSRSPEGQSRTGVALSAARPSLT